MNDLDESDLLTRELRRRSEDVGGHPIDFAAVRGSARSIRRRRTVLGGAVAAMVATVAVPAGLAVTSSLTPAEGPAQQPSFAASPSSTPTSEPPEPRPDGTFRLTTAGLPGGAAPQVPYIDGIDSRVVTPDGPVPASLSYQQVVRYGDGWLALGYDGAGAEMHILDADMDVQRSFPSGDSFAVSNDGSQVAYVEIQPDGSQMLVNAPTNGSDVQSWTLPARPAVHPVGVVSSSSVLYATQQGEKTALAVASPEGTAEVTGLVSASDADITSGLIAGQTRSDLLNGSCYGVLDPARSTTSTVWETCDYSIDGFSPDGRYLLGSIPDFDGMGAPTLAVLDARSGEPVVEFRPDRNDATALFQRTWEDDDTVLAIAVKGNTFSFLRFELDGSVSEAVEPVSVDDAFADVPFWFGNRAW